ncbi:MAG: hypothetical protein IJY01_03775 [Clostridia bacterium]|nr:hypothetical protein [Clostridia bacterium]
MENILIGVRRNKGELTDKDTGKKTPFDSISLFVADFRELGGKGFGISAKAYVVKVKTSTFYEVTGIKPKAFIEAFEEKFMFHKVRVFIEKNKFGKEIISSIKISKKDCYKLWQEEQDALADLDDEDEEDSSDVDSLYEDEVNDALDDFDGIDIDESTGEVTELPRKKKKGGEE